MKEYLCEMFQTNKSKGSWRLGLEKIYTFSLVLETKILWRLIFNEGMWINIMKNKFMRKIPKIDWLRLERNSSSKGSIV